MPRLEYAVSSQAMCWKCERKIGEGTLRLHTSVGGTSGYGSDPGYGPKKYMHLRCYRPNRKVDTAWFQGAGSLEPEDQVRLHELIEQWNDRPAVGGSGKIAAAKRASRPPKEKKEVASGPPRRSGRARKEIHPTKQDSDEEDEEQDNSRKRKKVTKAPSKKKAKVATDNDAEADAE